MAKHGTSEKLVKKLKGRAGARNPFALARFIEKKKKGK